MIDGNEEYPGGDLRSGTKQELWGAGAATLDKRTRAVASVTVPGGGYVSGWTDKRC